MRRAQLSLSVLALVAGLASVAGQATAHEPLNMTLQGNGSVQISRLPWLAGDQVFYTQGWNSPEGQGSHQGQYATDWAAASNASYAIYSVTEGDATCTPNDGGWGNRVDITRIDGKVERYAHLASCPFTSKHLEQGAFVAWSGGSGGVDVHLHYEMMGPSEAHCLSQFCDFDDDTTHRECDDGDPCHHHHPAVADNAGPGVNAAGNLAAWNNIELAYANIGHYLCGQNKAWDCFGSSVNFLGAGYLANSVCLGSSNDCGWNQDFLQSGKLHNFNWPEACASAYWVPDQFYIGWLQNTWLGQARSSPRWEPDIGQYVQYFRHGFIQSPEFGGTPTIVESEQSDCLV